jgi:hypothetical protein
MQIKGPSLQHQPGLITVCRQVALQIRQPLAKT